VIERVLGYIPKDILAQSYASLIHPDDLSSVQRSFADVLAGRLYPSDFRMRRRDGTFSWVRTSSRPIHKDGQIVGLQGILTDITTHKLSEERIREFSHRLLSVREQEKCRLSAALHHDVGSMAVGVSARMRAAEEDLRAGKADEALAAIEECRKLFNQSVERLKVLAVDLRPPDLDILGLTAALRQYFAGVTRDTALRIRFSDSSQGAVIEQDLQTVLFRIAQECVTNAIKHAKASAVRVTLAATKRSIVLSVTDNGKGFAPVQVPSRAGAGLGLIIMHEMVTVRGGEMTVDSAPGRGTKVKAEFHRNGDAVGTTGSPDSDPPPIGRNDAHSHIDC
jgi:PAS domain S-box-containing protein